MDTPTLLSALTHSLELSLASKVPTGSVAISKSGVAYPAGRVGSETHILDIPSELAVLVRALHNNDVLIKQVQTVVSDPTTPISPLVLKVLADHSVRTGIAIHYTVQDTTGKTLFETLDARVSLLWYHLPDSLLTTAITRIPASGKTTIDKTSTLSPELQLRNWALQGILRNFPTHEGASGYGTALLTRTGEIYYGGQYSSFEHRLNVHAEMGVLLNALMDGARDITHIGIVSSKFTNTPCSPCGCCRQLIAEMSSHYGFTPTICLFASENEAYVSHTITELLPVPWTNKK